MHVNQSKLEMSSETKSTVTIGIIATRPEVASAVMKVMSVSSLTAISTKGSTDPNTYITGRIGRHDTVLVTRQTNVDLPVAPGGAPDSHAPASAVGLAAIKSDMKKAFPTIKNVALLALGSAASADQKLGTIVVGIKPGIVPFVVRTEAGKVEVKDDESRAMWPPGRFWINAMDAAEAEAAMSPMELPKAAKGLIACGDEPVRDAAIRDAVRQYYKERYGKVYCIISEVAGMDKEEDLHYFLIGGIVDHGDGVKVDDKWSVETAKTAAVYLKAVIEAMPVTR